MKKTKKTEEVKDPNRLHSEEDKLEILRLFKVAIATGDDINSIHNLYKKYIKPNARPPITNCRCKGSLSHYWKEISDYWTNNGNKFE